MEHFIVSARKYRPQSFDDVVGQQAITLTLEKAIQKNHLAQALLFTGPRGVGKTTCARILAKRINEFDSDQTSEEDYAFNIFELDAASNNSVDDIRNLIDQVRIPPQVGNYKVYIIDEVHMLSQAAFNAFLKTLEEPPNHAIFILATTEKHKIIPTILSRCQIFDFKRITVSDAKNYLQKIAEKQGVEAEEDALHIIAQKADGAMRDALSIFDRVVSFSGNKLTRKDVAENLNVLDVSTFFEITDLIVQQKIPEVLLLLNEIIVKGYDGHQFIVGLSSHFRDLMVAKDKETLILLEVSDAIKEKYKTQAQQCSLHFLLKSLDLANQCDLNYKASKNQRLLIELTLMQMTSINFDGEKKNDLAYIIPATHFKENKADALKEKSKIIEETPKIPITEKPPEAPLIPKEEKTSITVKSKAITQDENRRPISSLSLKSISRSLNTPDDEQAPKIKKIETTFTKEKVADLWKELIDQLEKEGKKSIVSIMVSNPPEIENSDFKIKVSNDLMKAQLQSVLPKLLGFFHEKLKNNTINIAISVDEKVQNKTMAYTTQEKYEVFVKKNKTLETLRNKFNLEI